MIKILLIVFSCLVFETSFARVGDYAFYSQYNYYQDITQESTATKVELNDDVSLNLDIRVFRIVLLTFHGGMATDNSRSYGGIGFKVDLPGFFMIGARLDELMRRQKRRGANTSLYFKNYYISSENTDRKILGTKLGFSADFFLTKQYFLMFDVGLYSHGGNQYFNPAVGLGYEF